VDAGEQQFERLARFAELVAGAPAAVPLDQAALAMAAVLRSRPTDAAIALLDELAATCPEPTFAGLRRYLYEALGFAGDRRDLD
jgi:hypothetical protein